jgi:hypothetical protein
LSVLALPANAYTQAKESSLKTALESWQRRQDSFGSVAVKLVGERLTPKGALSQIADEFGFKRLQNGPSESFKSRVVASWILDLKGSRHVLEFENEEIEYNQAKNTGQAKAKYVLSKYDGKRLGAVNNVPKDRNNVADLTYYKGDLSRAFFDQTFEPLFVALSIVPIEPSDRPYPGHYNVQYNADFFYSDGRRVVDGVDCLVVSSRPLASSTMTIECWCDPVRDYLIIGYQWLSDKKTVNTVSLRYEKAGSGWVPRGYTDTRYSSGGNVVVEILSMNITAFDIAPAMTKGDFEFQTRSGMVVKEVELKPMRDTVDRKTRQPSPDRQSHSIVDSGGTPREVVFRDGVPHRTWRSYFNWVNVLLAALVVAGHVILYFCLRSRKELPAQKAS